MAKPAHNKNQPKPEASPEKTPSEIGKTTVESAAENAEAPSPSPAEPNVKSPAASPLTGSNAKKDPAVNRNKKGPTGSAKGTSLMPSQHKLENLKAAVAAAGSVDNLLLILQHVDEAGGRQEVAESVEAYRALKLALE